MTTAFISYAAVDKDAHDQIAIWQRQGLLGRVPIGYEPPDWRPTDFSDRFPTSSQLTGADKVILVVGEKTNKYLQIGTELDAAIAAGQEIIWVKNPGAASHDVPSAAAAIPETPFTAADLQGAL